MTRRGAIIAELRVLSVRLSLTARDQEKELFDAVHARLKEWRADDSARNRRRAIVILKLYLTEELSVHRAIHESVHGPSWEMWAPVGKEDEYL